MPDSWSNVDGVALDWDNMCPDFVRHYTRAISLAYRERIPYTSLIDATIYDTQFNNINSVHMLFYYLTAWGGAYWPSADFGLYRVFQLDNFRTIDGRAAWVAQFNESPRNGKYINLLAVCDTLGIERIDPAQLKIKPVLEVLQRLKTVINSFRYVACANYTNNARNNYLLERDESGKLLNVSWPGSLTPTLKIASYNNDTKTSEQTGTSPLAFPSVFSNSIVIDISAGLSFLD